MTFGADPVALKTTATTFVGSWLGTLTEIGGMCGDLNDVDGTALR